MKKNISSQAAEIRNRLSRDYRTVVVLLALLVFTHALSPAQAAETLTIGLVPEMNVFAQMQRFKPLAEYLERKTGLEVHLFMLSRYSNILESLQKQEVDAAFLGSYTATVAITQLKAIPVARPVNLDNKSTYHGYIFVRKDSGIRTTEDMRGKIMAFVEHATTAGYVFPLAWLRRNGVEDFKILFAGYFFAGSHDSAIDAVLNKKADIGAAKNTIYQHFLAQNLNAENELTIIASSDPVPSNGLCVLPTVSKETIAKLQTALLELDRDQEGQKVLDQLRALKFVKTETADYEQVVNLAREAGISLTVINSQSN